MTVLVVYYSRSGATARLAKAIARRLGADCDEITDGGRHKGVIGCGRAYFASLTRASTPAVAAINPANYKSVIVGSPVWGGQIASPVRQYLQTQDLDTRLIGGFCTSWDGGPQDQFFDELCNLAGHQDLKSSSVSQRVSDTGLFQYDVAKFTRAMFPNLIKSAHLVANR